MLSKSLTQLSPPGRLCSLHVSCLAFNIKKIKPVNPKENQPWISIGRTDVEAEAPILWPPDMKSRHSGKVPDERSWGQEEKQEMEDEMVGWHHWLNGHEFEQTPGDSEGQGSPVCCSPVQRVRHNLATEQQRVERQKGQALKS